VTLVASLIATMRVPLRCEHKGYSRFEVYTSLTEIPSSVMLHRVAVVRTEDLEERNSSIIGVNEINELGTLAVTSNRRTLGRNTMFMYV
jgi:hypothetical protein